MLRRSSRSSKRDRTGTARGSSSDVVAREPIRLSHRLPLQTKRVSGERGLPAIGGVDSLARSHQNRIARPPRSRARAEVKKPDRRSDSLACRLHEDDGQARHQCRLSCRSRVSCSSTIRRVPTRQAVSGKPPSRRAASVAPLRANDPGARVRLEQIRTQQSRRERAPGRRERNFGL